MARTGPVGTDREERIPVAEERLNVGKREVNQGRVRVRSYVVETPVQEQVNLRQEHVSVERRPVDRPVTGKENLFQERTIEATEKGRAGGREQAGAREGGAGRQEGRGPEDRDSIRHRQAHRGQSRRRAQQCRVQGAQAELSVLLNRPVRLGAFRRAERLSPSLLLAAEGTGAIE
jgi:hypothetical protein